MSTPRRGADGSTESIAALLNDDLIKGHRYKAIRHFLMLQGRGAAIAPPIVLRCEALLMACPASRRKRIENDVQKWLDMRTLAQTCSP